MEAQRVFIHSVGIRGWSVCGERNGMPHLIRSLSRTSFVYRVHVAYSVLHCCITHPIISALHYLAAHKHIHTLWIYPKHFPPNYAHTMQQQQHASNEAFCCRGTQRSQSSDNVVRTNLSPAAGLKRSTSLQFVRAHVAHTQRRRLSSRVQSK